MNRLAGIIIIVFFVGSVIAFPSWHRWYYKNSIPSRARITPAKEILNGLSEKLRCYIVSVKKFAAANHYETRLCLLADMTIPSGKRRFVVYDLANDSIIISGLVAHGSCDKGFQEAARFSNTLNSGCSCFGRFRVGKSYRGKFGLAYKLYGLDSSNNNAYQRNIVLHAYPDVPDDETYPLPICNSRGCPMVSPGFLRHLQSYIDNSRKPILLCIFNN
jgi:L,D-transpeptidase catalytic domain